MNSSQRLILSVSRNLKDPRLGLGQPSVASLTDVVQKGKDIVRLWRTDRQSFIRYMETDAVNPLLIAEYLTKSMGGRSTPQGS